MKPCDMTILLLIRERTPPPTIRELGTMMNKSNDFIQISVNRLVKLGYVEKEKDKSRTMSLTNDAKELIGDWVLGKEVDGKVFAPWDGK